MECPYCGRELDCVDHYGTGRSEYYYGTAANGIYYPSTYQKLGDIYSCCNASGFESKEGVMEYIGAKSEDDLEKYIKDNGSECWEEIVCESEVFNGKFYPDSNENLHEGFELYW